MIQFERYKLKNGLTLLMHKDKTTPIAAINVLYKVGSRNEDPEKTGFAHLFEHLMFGGSANIPVFDEPLERVGGENNAFTNSDITNYYITLPIQNIETAFWLESDRMNELAFSEKSLEVQRNVVCEEFKQSYLNQPYGDVWLNLRPLAYKVHPYQWCTIGKTLEHIQNATLQDVKDFFYTYYRPNNAILVVAGDINFDEIIELTEKWFGNIPQGSQIKLKIPQEPEQTKARSLELHRDVPFNAIYKAFHMCERKNPDYYTYDLISDILANGKSSRLYINLVKEKKIFSDINAYISGDLDKGLFIISGKLKEGIKMTDANDAVMHELEMLKNKMIEEDELQKVKNKVESMMLFSEMNILNRAMSLAYFEMLENAELINEELKKYEAINANDIQRVAQSLFKEEKQNNLFYFSNLQK